MRSSSTTRALSAWRCVSAAAFAAVRASSARRSHSWFSVAKANSARRLASSASRSAMAFAAAASFSSELSSARSAAFVSSRARALSVSSSFCALAASTVSLKLCSSALTFSSSASQCCLSVAFSREASRKLRAAASSRDRMRDAEETPAEGYPNRTEARRAALEAPGEKSSSESESCVNPSARVRVLPGVRRGVDMVADEASGRETRSAVSKQMCALGGGSGRRQSRGEALSGSHAGVGADSVRESSGNVRVSA
jgi:hypothetical protein